MKVAANFDAFEDGPWHDFELYLKFDKKIPNSKFILLERDLDEWVRSHDNHFSGRINANKIKGKYLISNYSEKEILQCCQIRGENHDKTLVPAIMN
ncbi:MAG: hypothetical protein GY705_22795 [Bacteroidetes bacterium]|nr:hypothetical protein [Bacteroidota bacterium]